MDRLIVLDAGRIIEQGSHEELLHLNSHYAALWRHQSGGFLDPEVPLVKTADRAPGLDVPEERNCSVSPERATDDTPVTARA